MYGYIRNACAPYYIYYILYDILNNLEYLLLYSVCELEIYLICTL